MNKKIKSLLVAGLLVVGMSGNVFADDDTPIVPPHESSITHIVLGDEYSLQDGGLKVTLDPSGMLVLKTSLDFNENYNLLNVMITLDDGTVENVTIDKFTTYGVGDGIEYQLNLASGRIDRLDVDAVKVCFEYVDSTDSDNDGVPDFKDDEPVNPEPPVEEEPEINDPNTGDAGMMVGVITVAAASIGLFVVNKKKDEE